MSSEASYLRDLLLETKDGEWGKAESFLDSVEMSVIRGTDFDTAAQNTLAGVPVRHIAGKAAARKTLKPGDILIETAGGSKGRPTGRTVFLRAELFRRAGRPLTCASFARFLRVDASRAEPEFVYWFLQSVYKSGAIENYQVQHTGIARFQFTKFADSIKVPMPLRESQLEIAGFLGALDNRITLLRETNATLEAIAQALFKSWFVDFDPVRAKMQGRAPEGMDEATAALFPDGFEESELGLVPKGWRSGQLGEVARTVRKQLQPSELHAGLHYVGLEHMPRKSLSLVDWATADGLESAKAAFREGDVLFGKLRPYFHKVVIAPFDGVCSTDVLVCQAVKPAFKDFVAMQLFSDALVGYAERLSNGAKMPRVNWSDLADYPVVVPTEDVALRFTEVVEPLFAQMKVAIQSAKTLATLRDTLLPRLISGQLRLPSAEHALKESVHV